MKLFLVHLISYAMLSTGAVLKSEQISGPYAFESVQQCEEEMTAFLKQAEEEIPESNWASYVKCRPYKHPFLM